MNDDELLELAAKAAGIEVEYRRGSGAYYYDDPETGREQWFPLGNDGQALRLAVQLGIQVTPGTYGTSEACAYHPKGAGEMREHVHYQQDMAAATRRAIVRTAAAIGEKA